MGRVYVFLFVSVLMVQFCLLPLVVNGDTQSVSGFYGVRRGFVVGW